MTDDERLNEVVRRQLHELRIDLGEVHKPPPRVASRFQGWRREHMQAVALLVIGATALVTILGVAIGLAAGLGAPLGTSAGVSTSATVWLDDTAIQLQPPDYRRFSSFEARLLLHLHVRNPTQGNVVLRAGDLVLADARGGLFPPSWQDAFGKSIDGVADPNHTLIALEPGGDVQIGLHFLVLSEGPFRLRYAPDPEHTGLGIPTLSLSG